MTWQQIKARSLAARVRGDRMQRTLVMWSTDAGDMFVHGMLASGPERDEAPDAEPGDTKLYFRMKYDNRSDGFDRWQWLPRITYGFRPARTEAYLVNADLGLGSGAAPTVGYFAAPTGRKNKLKFFVPSRDENDKLAELPGTAQMYDVMVRCGWESRHDWTYRRRQNLDYYRMRGSIQHDMQVTEILDLDVIDKVQSVMKERHPALIEMVVARNADRITLNGYWKRSGLIEHIRDLSVYDFTELLASFGTSMYTAPNANRYCGEAPAFPEDYDYLQKVASDLQDARVRREREVFQETIAERTGDEAWAEVVAERMHMARGNLIDDFNKAMKVEPEEVVRHPSDYEQTRNSIDAGVQVLD